MRIKMKANLLLWLILCLGLPLLAQQGVVSAGTDILSPSGTVAYSIGQTAYLIIDGETGSIYQGLQQPYSYSIVGIEDLREDIIISLFPNPASGAVYVQLTPPDIQHVQDRFTALLYDFNGKLLLHQQLPSEVNTIAIGHLTSANYLLHIWKGDALIKSFSFLKTN